jgi:hypothetical protein
MTIERKKVKLNGSISGWADDQTRELASTPEFGTLSNVYETAIVFFLGARYKECELRVKRAEDEITQVKEVLQNQQNILYELMLKHPELSKEIKELTCSGNPTKKPTSLYEISDKYYLE